MSFKVALLKVVIYIPVLICKLSTASIWQDPSFTLSYIYIYIYIYIYMTWNIKIGSTFIIYIIFLYFSGMN